MFCESFGGALRSFNTFLPRPPVREPRVRGRTPASPSVAVRVQVEATEADDEAPNQAGPEPTGGLSGRVEPRGFWRKVGPGLVGWWK